MREFGLILLRVWSDPEWIGLPMHGQWLYEALVSQTEINHAGVIPLTSRRWSRLCSNRDQGMIEDALKVLAEHEQRYVIIDEDTQELLVRSFIRNSGKWKQPNMFKTALMQAQQVHSAAIRAVLGAEILKLDRFKIGLMRTSQGEALLPILDAALAACGTPVPITPSEGYADGFGDGPASDLALLHPKDTPMGSANPSAKGAPLGQSKDSVPVVAFGPSSSAGFISSSKDSSRPASAQPTRDTTPGRDEGQDPPSSRRDDVEALCARLRNGMIAIGCKPPTITQEWRTQARLLLDRDGRKLDKALALIDWTGHDPFWSRNIHSMPKFRKQYDRLRLAANDEWKRNGAPRSADPETSFDELRRHGLALEASRLISVTWVEPSQNPADPTPPREWLHARRVEFIDAREAEIRAALKERAAR